MVRFVGDAFRLQRAQLSNSRNELYNAVTRIVDSLHKVASNTSDISMETGRLAGDNSLRETSLLISIEDGLSTVAESLRKSAGDSRELSGAVVSSSAQIGEISRFVDDIEETGSNVELIALNARVKAAHSREKGATMGVLAESIQKVSLQSLSHATSVAEILQEISVTTGLLKEHITGGLEQRESLVEELLTSMDVLLETLRSINQEVRSNLRRLDEQGGSLSAEIDGSVGRVEVHHRFSRMIDEIDGAMEMIENESRGLVAESGEGYQSEELEAMACRYTMEAERRIHKNTTSGADNVSTHEMEDVFFDFSTGDGLEDASTDSPAEDELGDNFELF